MLNTVVLIAVALVIASTPVRAEVAVNGFALVDGVVHSMDAERRTWQAILVQGETIAALGTTEQIMSLAGAGVQIIPLHGKSVFPGFTDAHVHPAHGGSTLLELSFTDTDDTARIQQKLRDYVEAHPGERVIYGSGWSLTQFDRGNPHKSVIDEVISDRPVVLVDSNHHSVWVNSRALAAAGITDSTPNPENGTIERNSAGQATGTLRESARALVMTLVPPASLEQRVARLTAGARYLNSLGYTAVVDAATDPALDEAWIALKRQGQLTVTPTLALLPDSLPLTDAADADLVPVLLQELQHRRALLQQAGISASMVKIFLDGGLESCTAAFLNPYAEAGCGTNHRGTLNLSEPFLHNYVTALETAGFQIHIHAIGDRATRVALNSIESAGASATAGHSITHLQFVHPVDMRRFAGLGVTANIQALWAFPYDDSMAVFEGTEIGPYRYPFRSLQEAGAVLVTGSDWPVSTANPFHAMEVAVRRRDPELTDGTPLLPGQGISVDQFMSALTRNGAAYLGAGQSRGTLEIGKIADLVVVSDNPYRVRSKALSDITVLLTMQLGTVVYSVDD